MRASADNDFALRVGRRVAAPLLVVALWVLGAQTMIAWLRADNAPPGWDPAWHGTYSLMYRACLEKWSLLDTFAGLHVISKYYPPFVHLCGALVLRWCGTVQPAWSGMSTAHVLVLTNLFFQALLLGGTYALATQFYGKRAGVFAAFLTLVYPILAAQSRLFLLDYPLTGLMATTLALLVASRGFTNKYWIWPLGIAASAGLWTKWSFGVLLLPPFLLALRDGLAQLRSGRDPELTVRRFTFNVGVVLVGMLLIAGPWYCSHLGATLHELRESNLTWVKEHHPLWYQPAGATYYVRILLSQQIFLPFALLGLFGIWYAWQHRWQLEGLPLLLGTLVGGLVLLTFVGNKNPRFSMPLLPVLAVLSASWLAPPPPGMKPRPQWQATRAWVLLLSVWLGLAEFHGVAFGIPLLGGRERLGAAWAPLFGLTPHLARQAVAQDWPHEKLAAELVRVTPLGGKIGVMPNTNVINLMNLRFYVYRALMPYLPADKQLVNLAKATVAVNGRETAVDTAVLLSHGYDTLVLMPGKQGPDAAAADESMATLQQEWSKFLSAYQPTASFKLPAEMPTVTVYQRRGHATAGTAEPTAADSAGEPVNIE